MSDDRMEMDHVRAIAALALRGDGVLTPATALAVIAEARRTGRDPGAVLAERLPQDKLLPILAAELNTDYIDLNAAGSAWRVDEPRMRELDMDTLRAASALVLSSESKGDILVVMANPFVHPDTRDYLTAKLGAHRTALASASQIQAKIAHLDASDISMLEDLEDLGTAPVSVGGTQLAEQKNPVVEWVDSLFARASVENASDVHLMFQADRSLLVRFRIDGILVPQTVPRQLRNREDEIVGTLLNKCPTIDPSDRRRPQDGTFSFGAPGGRRIDTRLGMLPQQNGPTIVVRLLDPDNVRRPLDQMGFAPETLGLMRAAVSKPQGMVLMVGPTGSGKTTSLYGLLNELDAGRLNILTAEDPVEYRMARIGQTQIRGDLGEKSLTFAKALRAFLRLDPDVILVGEIRDRETAEVAVHASLTGHLLLSTLHANSALEVVTRLVELGVEPFAVAETLSLAASQRLVRRLHTCARIDKPTEAEAAFLRRQGLEVPDQIGNPAPGGCPACNGTGYAGRIPVMEAFSPTEELRSMIAAGASLGEIKAKATDQGYVSIIKDAYRHVAAGSTSVPEMLRCLNTGGL